MEATANIMRNLCEPDIDRWRRRGPEIIRQGGPGDDTVGAFRLPSPVDGKPLEVGAGSCDGWDHVRVWRTDRIPDWTEMEYVKRLFFKANETAMQLHVPPVEYINYHSHSLHLWRPHNTEIPRPPNERVWSWSRGPKTEETILASLAAGMTFASACRAAGKTPDEITVYLEQFPDFENRIRATLSKKRCD